MENISDAIVVGAGPAGLTAAIYLGRFRRRCILLDNGNSRARWIPTSHNIPGFAAGIGGEQFLSSLRAQALRYGAQIRQTHVSGVTLDNGIFALRTDETTLYSRYVLLATGVKDHLPAIEGAAEAVMRSLLRICPICDAFEAIDKRIAVIGDGGLGEREAEFLSNYSSQVTLLHTGSRSLVSTSIGPGSSGVERLSIRLSDLRIQRTGSHSPLQKANGASTWCI